MSSEQPDPLMAEAIDTLNECQKFMYVTRGKEFQIQSIEKLNQLLEQIFAAKAAAVAEAGG